MANSTKSLGAGFVMMPTPLLENPSFSPEEKVLWALLKAHQRDKAGSYPSVASLAKRLSRGDRQTRTVLSNMEKSGLIRKKRRPGQTNYYVVIAPDPPRQPTTGGPAVHCR